MTATPRNQPLLIAVLDQFDDRRIRTADAVAAQMHVPRTDAEAALERLEDLGLLVRVWTLGDAPVWKRHADPDPTDRRLGTPVPADHGAGPDQ